MINLDRKTYKEIDFDIAKRIIKLRKRKKISQRDLALKSSVSYASIKRFEQTGEISLGSLTKIAIALDVDKQLDNLFDNVPFNSIEEVINEQNK